MASAFKRTSERKTKGSRWTICYTDEHGKRRTRKAFTDKAESLRLAEKLEDDARKRRDGLINDAQERFATHALAPIQTHVVAFERSLVAKGSGQRHIKQTIAYVNDGVRSCGWERLANINADAAQRRLGELRDRDGLGARTLNARRTALRCFTRWLVAHGRLRSDPLTSLKPLRESDDRRRVRRPLSDEELEALLEATAGGPTRAGMSGLDRAMLYRVLAATGLRRGEAGSLTPESFRLDGDSPTVTVRAGYSKRRREDTLPLPDLVAAALGGWLTDRPRGRPLWPLPDKPYPTVLKPDLASAREAWLRRATTEGERASRRSGDFLVPVDAEGRVVDFHSFRHGFITRVVSSGAPVSVAQRLARHSTPMLTLGTYSHVRMADEREAIRRAFGPTDEARESLKLRATGTYDAGARSAERSAQDAQARPTPHERAGASDRLKDQSEHTTDTENRLKRGRSAHLCAPVRGGAAGEERKPPVGLEPTTSRLQISGESSFTGLPDPSSAERAAQMTAHRTGIDTADAALARVVKAWPTLPAHVKAAISALVNVVPLTQDEQS